MSPGPNGDEKGMGRKERSECPALELVPANYPQGIFSRGSAAMGDTRQLLSIRGMPLQHRTLTE